MARAALRPLTAFRPRGAKSPGKPGDRAGRFPWSGTRNGGGAGAKAAARTDRKAGAKAAARTSRQSAAKTDRPLPFPLRLLAMLCAFAFMVAFAVALARITLEPSPASAALVHSNLRPGDSLRAYLDQPALRDAVKQIGGNLLLGVPFGVLVPVVAPRARGLLRVLLLTATVMLLVEFAQGALVTGRAFDIDDVILNTAGALIGYLILGRRVGRAVHARKPRA
ncbi:VanZ family protein [Streptomyces sp. NPDC020597]|uniref:VanZ family protein n=1 Tax=unclassified Streptomyces TaxID=2593676 RepID=UPI0037A807E5